MGLVALVAIGLAWPGLTGGSKRSLEPIEHQSKTVTLVIDFGDESGRPVESFDLTSIKGDAKGWDLFSAAGLDVLGTDQFPTGFVCRIEGWPGVESRDCADTPTFSEGHWAYYVTNTKLGSGWILSGQGAAMHEPKCAGYEGWSWVKGNEDAQAPRFKPTHRECHK